MADRDQSVSGLSTTLSIAWTRPAPLSAEQHAANRECLSTVRFVNPKYSAETEINVSGIFGRWKRYCSEKEVGDWRATIVNLTRATTMDFFLLVCGNYNVRSWALHDCYRALYDRNDAKEVYKVSKPELEHLIMSVNRSLVPPQCFDPSLQSPSAKHRRQAGPQCRQSPGHPDIQHRVRHERIQSRASSDPVGRLLPAPMLYWVPTAELVDGERKGPKIGSEIPLGQKVIQEVENDGSANQTLDKQSVELNKMLLQETIKRGRPKALCYEDILLMLVRHPATGKPVLAMAIKFIHHKGADNKPKPCVLSRMPPHYRLVDC
ncbi:hypothetical protein CRV24_000435 [Beauveria bassiana]|nr:hypothetical protein CRV24_000435 [Beauveria bassiana]KAH8721018.1 hypothetical protein HC256_001393 [Beauveria bassiana]